VTASRLLLGATALAAACAPAMRTSAPAPVNPIARQIIDRQALTARLAFDSAARKGDREAMRRWLAEDAIIVYREDTLRGGDAIARMLSTSWPGASEPLHFAPGKPEACVDGTYELGTAYTIGTRRVTAGADTVRYRYGFLWRQADSTRVLLRAVAVAPAPDSPPELRGCVRVTPIVFDATRLRIAVFTPAAYTWWHAASSMQDRLSERGYGTVTPDVGSTPWAMIGLRLRAWRGLSIEGVLALQSARDSVAGFNGTTGSAISTSFRRSGLMGAILGYEWHRLRLGAGPVFFTDTWSIQQRLWVDLGNPNGATLTSASKLDSWTEHRTGLLLEAAYTVPIAPFAFVEARAQQWSVGSRQIHGAGFFPPVVVNTSAYTLAVSTGLAF